MGGRALTDRTGAAPIELGGQWIGAGDRRLRAQAREHGLTTYTGHSVGGGRTPRPRPRAARRKGPFIGRHRHSGRRRAGAGPVLDPVPPHRPHRAVALARRGTPRLGHRLRMDPALGATRRGRRTLEAAVRNAIAVEPDSLSMLALLVEAGADGLTDAGSLGEHVRRGRRPAARAVGHPCRGSAAGRARCGHRARPRRLRGRRWLSPHPHPRGRGRGAAPGRGPHRLRPAHAPGARPAHPAHGDGRRDRRWSPSTTGRSGATPGCPAPSSIPASSPPTCRRPMVQVTCACSSPAGARCGCAALTPLNDGGTSLTA